MALQLFRRDRGSGQSGLGGIHPHGHRADLRGWAAFRLEKFKLPDVMHAMAKLPAGRTGKADRAALRVLLG